MTIRIKNVATITATLLSLAVFSLPAFADASLGTGGYSRAMHDMKLMKMFDTDGDHKVSKDEFTAFYEAAFNELDKNGDGYLDAKEWVGNKADHSAMIGTGGYNRELRRIAMMNKMDTDGDHKVSKEEFLNFHLAAFNSMSGGTDEITAQQWAGKVLSGH